MDIRRVVLYGFLFFILYSLWLNWQKDYPSVSTQTTVNQQQSPIQNQGENVSLNLSKNNTATNEQQENVSSTQLIRVTTDILSLTINSKSGNIVEAKLLAYPVSTEQKDVPFTLLTDQTNQEYLAKTSLLAGSGQTATPLNVTFQSQQFSYHMGPDQQEMTVSLQGETDTGLKVVKNFVFKRDDYLININYQLMNQSEEPWKGYLNTQLVRSNPQEDKSSIFHIGTYTGASYSNPGHHRYEKVSFSNMAKNNLNVNAQGGWIAMQQHYFLSAWIPDVSSKNLFYTRVENGDYSIGTVSQPLVVAPNSQAQISTKLYVGPEDTARLKAISPGLDLTVDYGWLWFLSSLLFSLMKAIHSVVGNWGWSIILVTVLIKLAFFRLSASSYKSMASMRKLQPKLLALRERYGDDKAKLSQATMELYRQEKVNPLGGCLPILVQIPVFIALYWVLLESVELRQAPFVFWINDLAAADPYHILPIIMGITMLIQQRLNPAPPDPMQAKVMMCLPVLFTFLFWSFPAGLVLYWIMNNTLSILQQWYITRKYSDDKPITKKKPTTVK